MTERRTHCDASYAHFVSFACFRRRRHLDHPSPRRIVVDTLAKQLDRLQGICSGFVIMPNHVHVLLWFPTVEAISECMKQWKRMSSYHIKRQLDRTPSYASCISRNDPIWQPRYHDFLIFNERKLREKLEYMHQNPVRAELVDRAEQWRESSARYYLLGEQCGIAISFPS